MAAARANGPGGLEAVRLAFEAAEQLPDDASILVRDTVLAALNVAMRAIIMRQPDMQNYVLKSEIMRQWRAEAVAEGVEKGREEGRESGLEEGLRRMIVKVLVSRAIPLDDAARERIAAMHDVETLERWGDRAVKAGSLAEVFRE